MEVDRDELQQLADELRGLAAFGINFAGNPHDTERWEHVLAASARLAALTDGRKADALYSQHRDNHFDVGPVGSGEAVVFQDDKILLVRRADDGLWALPGGITDPGETLAETAQRELWEEAGVCGRVTQLLGVFDSRLWHSEKKIHFYHAVFAIEIDDTPKPGPEVSAARFFAENELPPLSPGHHLRAPFVFKQRRGEVPVPYFDPVDSDCG